MTHLTVITSNPGLFREALIYDKGRAPGYQRYALLSVELPARKVPTRPGAWYATVSGPEDAVARFARDVERMEKWNHEACHCTIGR